MRCICSIERESRGSGSGKFYGLTPIVCAKQPKKGPRVTPSSTLKGVVSRDIFLTALPPCTLAHLSTVARERRGEKAQSPTLWSPRVPMSAPVAPLKTCVIQCVDTTNFGDRENKSWRGSACLPALPFKYS